MTSALRRLLLFVALTCLPVLLSVGCGAAAPSGSGAVSGGRDGGGTRPAPSVPSPGSADCIEISGEARLPAGAAEPLGDLEVLFMAPGTVSPTGRPTAAPLHFVHVTNRRGLPFRFRSCAPQAKLDVAAFMDMDGDHEVSGLGDQYGHASVEVPDSGLAGVVIMLDGRFDKAKEGTPPSD